MLIIQGAACRRRDGWRDEQKERERTRGREWSGVVAFRGRVFNNSAGGVWSDSDAAGGCSETRKITQRIKKTLTETFFLSGDLR